MDKIYSFLKQFWHFCGRNLQFPHSFLKQFGHLWTTFTASSKNLIFLWTKFTVSSNNFDILWTKFTASSTLFIWKMQFSISSANLLSSSGERLNWKLEHVDQKQSEWSPFGYFVKKISSHQIWERQINQIWKFHKLNRNFVLHQIQSAKIPNYCQKFLAFVTKGCFRCSRIILSLE